MRMLCGTILEGFLAVHSKDGGEKTMRLRGKAAKVTDLLSGETVAQGADSFTCTLDRKSVV